MKVSSNYLQRLMELGFELNEENPTFSPFKDERSNPDNYSILVLRKR